VPDYCLDVAAVAEIWSEETEKAFSPDPAEQIDVAVNRSWSPALYEHG